VEELAVLPEVRQAVQHTEVVEFLLERLDDVAHSDDTVVVGSQYRGSLCGVADVPAGDLEASEELVVETLGWRQLGGGDTPDLFDSALDRRTLI
jgi:hypothetical protein